MGKDFVSFILGGIIYLAFAAGASYALFLHVISIEKEDPIQPILSSPTPLPSPSPTTTLPSTAAIVDLENHYYLDTGLQGEECKKAGGTSPRDGYGCEITIDSSKPLVINPNNPPPIIYGKDSYSN